jgi:hypothetical protein
LCVPTQSDSKRFLNLKLFLESSRSAPVNPMISYIDAPYNISFDAERGSQVADNFCSMNRFAVDSR